MLIPISTVVYFVLTLFGLAVPFLHVVHPRQARGFMAALVGLTVLWTVLYEVARLHFLGPHAPDHIDMVLLRGYVFSAGICTLMEECLSYRDAKKRFRPVFLIITVCFMSLTLVSFVAGVFSI